MENMLFLRFNWNEFSPGNLRLDKEGNASSDFNSLIYAQNQKC